MPNYVCGRHNEVSVNWRGQGCAQCASMVSRKVRRREERRRRELEAEDE